MIRPILIFGIWALAFFALPALTLAVLPPDLIVAAGSQIIQLFAILSILGVAIFSTTAIFYRQVVVFIARFHISLMLIVIACLATFCAHYAIQYQRQAEARSQLELHVAEMQINSLQSKLSDSYTKEEIDSYVTYCSDSESESLASSTVEDLSTPFLACKPGKQFFSDIITIYAELATGPLVFEIDLNRLEKIENIYDQYFFFNSFINGEAHADYQTTLATTSNVVSKGFLQSFTRSAAADQSTRWTYDLTVIVQGIPYDIHIDNIVGDFITRDTPDYVRYESVGNATVKAGDQEFQAHALVETQFSVDYRSKIFFAGRNELKVSTTQFMFWDDLDNFYVFDSTKPDRVIPQYVAHTWALYKDATTNMTKKTFEGTYSQSKTPSSTLTWQFYLPEFSNSKISVETKQIFKQEGDLTRSIVEGTIQDQDGVRTIWGIGHTIN